MTTKSAGVTIAIKRCKGCVFWDVWMGSIENKVMRKLYDPEGGQIPGRRRHACQLILRAVKNEDGTFKKTDDDDAVLVPVPGGLRNIAAQDTEGPNFGRRTRPDFSCQYHTSKNPPYVKPDSNLGGAEHVVDPKFLKPLEPLMPPLPEGELTTVALLEGLRNA